MQGTVAQIKGDLALIDRQGVTEVFLDLNFGPLVMAPDVDPTTALQHAEQVLSDFAPTALG